MFAQQIQSIESQIQELNAKLTQYRSLDQEVETALAAIARIKESALALGVEDEVSQQIMQTVGVNQSVNQPVVQRPIAEVEIQPVAETEQQVNQEVKVQPVVQDLTVKEPTPVPEPREVDGEALIGHKVTTPEGLTGLAKSLEPLHKEMIIVEFTNGSSPYFKTDLQRVVDQSTPVSPRPERFYYQEPEAQPQVQVGDLVQIHSGEVCEVLQVKDIGNRTYIEVRTPSGRKEAYRPSDLKPVDEVEQEARESILPPAQQVEMPLGITTGDLVECPDGRVGHISEVEFKVNTGRVATVVLPGGNAKIPVLELRYIGKYQQPKVETKKDPEIEAQRLGAEILGKSWSDIREQTKLYPKALREAGLAARTRTQKKWVEELPQAIADYILSSDDDSDLTWLPNSVKTRVQVLLQEARVAA